MPHDTPAPPVIRRFLIVAAVAPAVLTLLAVAAQLIAMPQLPGEIAVHWGAGGQPDGFVPAWSGPLITGLVGIVTPALIVVSTLPGLRRGDRGPTYRFMGALAAGLSVFVVTLLTWTIVMQAGLPDAREATGIAVPLLASYAAAALAGVAAWFVQPKQAPASVTRTAAEPLTLAATERAAWMRETSLTPAWTISIVALVVAAVASTIASWLLGVSAGAVAGLGALSVVLLALAATTTVFRVRVDENGLSVVSALGFPRFRVAAADVDTVGTVTVNPIGEFGGWGLRWAPGRFGVILRAGEAIQVSRHSGRTFVVTVGDAATGAALLQAVAGRHAAGRG